MLLLVRQRLKTLGTFSRDASHYENVISSVPVHWPFIYTGNITSPPKNTVWYKNRGANQKTDYDNNCHYLIVPSLLTDGLPTREWPGIGELTLLLKLILLNGEMLGEKLEYVSLEYRLLFVAALWCRLAALWCRLTPIPGVNASCWVLDAYGSDMLLDPHAANASCK